MKASLPIRVDIVFGTRPEAIKLLRLIQLVQMDNRFAPRVILTGQHREMPGEILHPFGVTADHDLGLMRQGQSLNEMLARMIPEIDRRFAEERPNLVVVQGDTTSAFAAALTAFHRGVPVAHVEAGLRSFDRFHPYPEEANRRMLTCLSDLHFAPTAYAAENLLREGVPREEILVTGNTVVDALHLALEQIDISACAEAPGTDGRVVLFTLHRREGWGPVDGSEAPLESVLAGLREAARRYPTVEFIYPLHPNPRVREPAERLLAGSDNVALLDPLPYLSFVRLMARATVIVTDSGGIQEEAPSLGVPVLVLRRTTERPESLQSGDRLLGCSPGLMIEKLATLLERPQDRIGTPPHPNPFGDGRASGRICEGLLCFMGLGDAPDEFGEPRPMHSKCGPGPR